MSSRWFYKDSVGQEQGPVEFDALARLIVDGVLTESDLARSAHSNEWTELDLVIGLQQTVDRIRRHQATKPDKLVHQAPAKQLRRGRQSLPIRTSATATSPTNQVLMAEPSATPDSGISARASIAPYQIATVAVALIGIMGFIYWLRSPTRFPESIRTRRGSVPLVWKLPGIGTVNQVELTIVVLNVLLVLIATVCFFWWRRNTNSNAEISKKSANG